MPNSILPKVIKFIIGTTFLSSTLLAQSLSNPVEKSGSDNSPYSLFGLGVLSETPNASLRAMGGSGAGYNDEFTINPSNPASYSFIRVTTFDAAFHGLNRNVNYEGRVSKQSFTGNISYLTLAIPIKNVGGFSFGLKPISNKYYNLGDTSSITADDKVIRQYIGKGGLQNVYGGLGLKYKNFSVGGNFGYTFGNFVNQDYISSYNYTSIRNYLKEYTTNYGSFTYNLGVMYAQKFENKYFLNIGATYDGSQALKGTKNGATVVSSYGNSTDGGYTMINSDSLDIAEESKGELVLPQILGFGINGGAIDKWEFNADVKIYDWKKYNNWNDRTNIKDQSFRLGIGGSFTPKVTDLYTINGKYLNAVTYRLGFFYSDGMLNINNHDIKDIGGTFGFSFPIKRNQSSNQLGRVHTSFIIGTRGTYDAGLAKELYFNFTIGASLSDVWFIKPKYD